MRVLAVPVLCVLALQGCAAPSAPAHPPVPAVLAEDVPAPPELRVALIWQPGHYDWTSSDYKWIPGVWVERAGHGTLWQDGYWQRNGSIEVWLPAHWV